MDCHDLKRNVWKLKSPRATAEADKKRKDLHEYSDEALVDGEEEVHVAPSRKANKVSIGDVEDKKRKDLHEDSDEALVDGEEEVHVAPSRTAKIVFIGDVPAAPAEPDAPRDTPTDKQVSDFSRWTVARCTAHCLTRTFSTTSRILLAQEWAAKCLRLTNPKVEIPTTKTDSPLDHRDAEQGLWEVPAPLEEGSGMKPL